MTRQPGHTPPTSRRSPGPSLLVLLLTAVAVFALALVLVTGAELLLGHPLSGGLPGQTTMSALFLGTAGH